jgi:4-hydroxybenzoate polyprenyltransferase
MIRRIRTFIVLSRPALVLLVALFTAAGLAQAGHPNQPLLLAKALTAVIAALVFAVAVNDLADERIDSVNLQGDRRRPLVTATATQQEMRIVAATSAVIAIASSFLLAFPAPLVIAGGLLFTAAYSLRPIRIAERGVLAPMLLPAGYVAVPYLSGIFVVRGAVHAQDVLLLAGLYCGFIGRILLKDFRDVRGDALFGKRTFLVRHGRAATCKLSAVFLVLGVSVLPFVRALSPALVAAYLISLSMSLVLLRALVHSTSARRDSAIIAAFAVIGRGMVLTLYAHFAMVAAHWSAAAMVATLAALTLITVGAARDVLQTGPLTSTYAPESAVVDLPVPVG